LWKVRVGKLRGEIVLEGRAMAQGSENRKLSGEEFRLLLQLETVLLVWMRTSLSLMGFGFVIARFGLFLREIARVGEVAMHPRPLLTAVSTFAGTALMVVGVAVLLIAVVNHRRAVNLVMRGELPLSSRWSAGVVVSLILAAIGLGMAIYLTAVEF
jgi:putative membrane protein